MTTSNFRKAFKQLKNKPNKLKKYMKHSAPKERSCGISKKPCKVTGRHGAHVGKYGIGLCRQAFRQYATKIGFKKYN
jgi:ribosomal protein S14